MTTNTRHWRRDVGWPCPACHASLPSPEQLQIHVANHARQDQKRRERLERVLGPLAEPTRK